MVAAGPASAPLPSLLAITIRRALLAGRLYVAIGALVSLVLAVVLLRTAASKEAFALTFPLELPLFASLASLGGILLFVSDRSKGVLEYLIAYGVRPSSLYLNCLVAAAILSTIVLGLGLAVGLGGYLAVGQHIDTNLENSILGYTVPMTYASALFSTTCGMIWSGLSTPRAGMNSPVGVTPMLGVAPALIVLILAEGVDRSQYYDVTVAGSLAVIAVVAVLLVASTRLMSRERFLSPM